MKVCLLNAILTLICSLVCNAQSINYESTFEAASAKSKQLNKPLVIVIVPDFKSPVAAGYTRMFSDRRVVERYNQNFVCYKAKPEDQPPRKEYYVRNIPALVFIDSKGGVLLKYTEALNAAKLLSLADSAIAGSKEKSLIELEAAYKSGERSKEFLKEYITKRIRADINPNTALIDEYVKQLSVGDLDRYEEVLFILKAGPLVDGKAYKLAYTNQKLIDSIYKTEPGNERTIMNNLMIKNTMDAAIASKNESQAFSAAQFTQNTWGQNYQEGSKNFQSKMLQYYLAVKDTMKYLLQASGYYDQYYMNVGADSLKKLDAKIN